MVPGNTAPSAPHQALGTGDLVWLVMWGPVCASVLPLPMTP